MGFLKSMTALGARRGVVIVGRGGQCILKENPRTLHVRFVAEFEDRVAWTSKRRALSEEGAREFVRKVDARSQDYLRFYFDCDPDQPALYDVVLNTSRISIDRCVEIVEGLAVDLASATGEAGPPVE